MTTILQGVDVSNNNGPVDWPAVARAGIAFAFLKRSEGVGYADQTFGQHWARAKLAGIPVLGAYHYARPDLGNAPEAEATYFVSQLPPLEPGDCAILDLETAANLDLNAWALAWCQHVKAALGFPPLLYSYANFVTQHLTDPALGAYSLWLADYGTLPPSIGPWQSVAIWQYTDSGSVPGIAGKVDRSQLARDLAGLKALGKPTPQHKTNQAGALKPTPDHTSKALEQLPADTPVEIIAFAGWTLVKAPSGRTGWIPTASID